MRMSFIYDQIVDFSKSRNCINRLFYNEPVIITELREFYLKLKGNSNEDRDLEASELFTLYQILNKDESKKIADKFWNFSIRMVFIDLEDSKLMNPSNLLKLVKAAAYDDKRATNIMNIFQFFANYGMRFTQDIVDKIIEYSKYPRFYDLCYQHEDFIGDRFDKIVAEIESGLSKIFAMRSKLIDLGAKTPSDSKLFQFFGYSNGAHHPLSELKLLNNVKSFLQPKKPGQ